MNRILLIDRLNPESTSNEKHDVFFLLGGMKDVKIENKLIDIINNSGITESKNMVLKYNGIHLDLKVQDIPIITQLFVKNNILIYGIYQTYSPEEDFL